MNNILGFDKYTVLGVDISNYVFNGESCFLYFHFEYFDDVIHNYNMTDRTTI